MARIAIAEPHDDVRDLLARVVERLGHEPVDAYAEAPFDVLLLEPASERALALAEELRRERPELPLIYMSIYPQTSEARALDPVAFLAKPFALADVERAVSTAVERAG